MEKNIWNIAEKAPREQFETLAEYHPILVQLLYNRGLKKQSEVDEFFNPDFEQDLADPYLFKDMKRAVKRIIQAAEKDERVAIYGDYDADGVTSSSIMTELFKALGLKGQVYLPDREKEGYGLNNDAIDWLKNKKIDLIVTTDCGISNKKEIDYAISEGIDVVVFDHHTVPEEFPKKYIIVNPKQKDDTYPFKDFCAAGIIFKLAEAFYRHEPDHLKVKNKEAFLKWLLDLAAIGTVADCMPLLNENRTLVTYGLAVMNKSRRLGLKKMLEKAGSKGKLDAYHIGFVIAPRINAAGRIDHANSGYKLLNARTERDAESYAIKIESTNKERQDITAKIYNQACSKITEETLKKKILIVRGEDWPIGVLGIVAGRLTQSYSRPVIVMSSMDGKKYTGSGRGPKQFNLIAAIGKCKNLLEEYGGHKQAAGMGVLDENFEKFKEKMEAIADKELTEKDLVKTIDIDLKLNLSDINWKLFDEIKKMEPFGQANPEPVFAVKNVKLTQKTRVGRAQQHLKCSFKDDEGNKISAVGFNLGEKGEEVKRNNVVNFAGVLNVNEWNGNRELQIRLIDIENA